MSKFFYLGSTVGAYIGSFAFAFVAGARAFMQGVSPWGADGGQWMFLVVISAIYLMVVQLILWWKAWKSVQEYGARTTPGQAIGFLFLPVVNLYWVFQAFWGYSKDFNSNIDEYGLDVRRLPEGLFLAHTIVMLGAALTFWIAVLNLPLALGNIVLTCLVTNKVVDSVNDIRRAPLPEKKGLIF
jgi:hypothetical protein